MTERRSIELSWLEKHGRACLRARGFSNHELRDLERLTAGVIGSRFAVLPSEILEARPALPDLQPIAGRFELEADGVVFVPRFPFTNGVRYSLRISPGDIWSIQRPSPKSAHATSVTAVYPAGDVVPVNLLRLYVCFSNPMSEGWAARAVHIRRAQANEPLEDVFLLGPELWDPEKRRITVLLDPGRIKRGLVPNAEAGYPLVENEAIIVSVDAQFRDAVGRRLLTCAEARYRVGPLLRERVDPALWRLAPAAAGTTRPLTVEFDRPLDHALLSHCLWVHNAAGEPFLGTGSIGAGERSWAFQPDAPWVRGTYTVVVDTRLEDLAGNSIVRVFDRDLARLEDDPRSGGHVALDFRCG